MTDCGYTELPCERNSGDQIPGQPVKAACGAPFGFKSLLYIRLYRLFFFLSSSIVFHFVVHSVLNDMLACFGVFFGARNIMGVTLTVRDLLVKLGSGFVLELK